MASVLLILSEIALGTPTAHGGGIERIESIERSCGERIKSSRQVLLETVP